MALMIGAGVANADEVIVSSDITVSTTWTADNTYNLTDQIYVDPGCTLTIEAGTVIASDTGVGGSLAIANGAQIFVLGTRDKPVIMTSKSDVATWGGEGNDGFNTTNPVSGTWREAANEWGNLTIMGDAYISEDATLGNTAAPSASNVATMEGLNRGGTIDEYGGGDDDYDAGTIRFLSLRFGGKRIGLNNELNGLSLGGVGRDTDIHHIDIMNNVDDGVEVWGGTVNLKYINVWNIGDDSIDVDQGWRGQAQFILIVQGHSQDDEQGSGVGDNCFETDGAEDSNYQPRTRCEIYNATVIGQPLDGDGGTVWRDNAGVQYRNSIFMDLGSELVQFDNDDGDGASGYGAFGTLSWPAHWTTASSVLPSSNPFPVNPAQHYTAQGPGSICEITDSVLFRNLASGAYTESAARGVGAAGKNNVLTPGSNPNDAPIRRIVRGPAVVKGSIKPKTILPVVLLDPRPANAALSSVGSAPSNGFYSPAAYRGAFAPSTVPWICGWTAADQFGFVDKCKLKSARNPKSRL